MALSPWGRLGALLMHEPQFIKQVKGSFIYYTQLSSLSLYTGSHSILHTSRFLVQIIL